MQVITKVRCPVCGNRFAPKNPTIGLIIRCPSCTLDLRIIGRDPITAVVDDSWEEEFLSVRFKKAKMTSLRTTMKEEAS